MSVISFSCVLWVLLLWFRGSWIVLQHYQLTNLEGVKFTWEPLGLMGKTHQCQSEDDTGWAEILVLELAGGNELSAYRLRAWWLHNTIRGHRLSRAARESPGTAGCQFKTHQLPATIIHQTVLCARMWHRKKSRMAMAWRDPAAIWSISCCIFMLQSTRVDGLIQPPHLLHFQTHIYHQQTPQPTQANQFSL